MQITDFLADLAAWVDPLNPLSLWVPLSLLGLIVGIACYFVWLSVR
jgi:hypothetical protein